MVHRVHRPAAVPTGRRQRHPGRGDPGARRAGRRPARRPPRPARRRCSPSGRPTRRATGPPTWSTRSSGCRPTAPRCWSPAPTSSPTRGWRPDGVTLSWLQWDHPNMPWDAAQLVVRAADGTDHVLAGGPGRVRRPARLGRGPRAVVVQRPHRLLVAVPQAAARGRRSSSSTSAATSPGRSGCSGRAASRCSPTAGSRSPTAATAPTGSPSSRPTGACASSTCPFSAFRYLTAQGTRGGLRRRRPVQRAGGPAGRRRRRGARDPPPGPRPRPRPGLVLPARARHLPDRGRGTGIAEAHALVYPPTNPEAPRAGRRPAAADGDRARRPDLERRPGAQPRGAVLDLARLLRRRRRLPRLDRLRPPLPGRAAGPLGHPRPRRRRRLRPATSPTAAGWTRRAWRSAAGRPAATRRWRR